MAQCTNQNTLKVTVAVYTSVIKDDDPLPLDNTHYKNHVQVTDCGPKRNLRLGKQSLPTPTTKISEQLTIWKP